jgi:hypothetical protein
MILSTEYWIRNGHGVFDASIHFKEKRETMPLVGIMFRHFEYKVDMQDPRYHLSSPR